MKRTVSLRMADIITPAISLVMLTPFWSYIAEIIVAVLPTGSLWKKMGLPVWMSPILW